MSDILDATTLPELRDVLRYDRRWNNDSCFIGPTWLPQPGCLLSNEELSHMFQLCEAIWWYHKPVSSKRPHAIMRNGKHTDFFVNCMKVEKESILLTPIAYQLIMRCADHTQLMREDDWVIGAERAGAPIAQEVARILGCRHATVEKDELGNPTKFDRFEIEAGQRGLLVNDLLSHKDGSTYMEKVAVLQSCPEADILPVAMHFVNRSGFTVLEDGTPVRALLDFEPKEYPEDDCKLCQGGSLAMKFKSNEALFYAL